MATTTFNRVYIERTLGLQVPLLSEGLPSLFWFRAGWANHNRKHFVRAEEVLLWPDTEHKSHPVFEHFRYLRERLQARIKHTPLVGPKKLYKSYTKEQILQHRAVVVLPYAEWSLSLADFYWAGVTLFVPHPEAWTARYTDSLTNE